MNKNQSSRQLSPLDKPGRRMIADSIAGCITRLPRVPKIPRAKTILAAALACACLALPEAAHASLMAYEGFNYTAGNGNLTGQNGGFGWKGGWQGVVNGSSSVLSGSLAAGANAPSGYDALSTGKSSMTPNGTRTGRRLDTSAGSPFGLKGFVDANGNIGAAGKTIYISFLQQPNVSNNNYYEFEFHRGDLNDGGRIGGIGSDTGGSSSVYLRTPAANQTVIGPASTSVTLYVVRIDFMGGNDTVTIYQNPTSATEPAVGTLVEAGAGDMSFNGFSFGAFVGGTTVAHDEVRIGETYSDVVSPGIYSMGRWMGGGANNNWSTGGNWDGGLAPVFPSSVTFTGSTGLGNTNDLSGISANAITFDSAAGAFTLRGNSLGVAGTIGFNANPASSITQTLALPLTPTIDFGIDTPANGNLLFSGGINTGSILTKTGGGTMTLGGSNSFGGFGVNGGTNILTGDVTVTGTGGQWFYVANGANNRNGVASSVSTLIIQPGATLTVQGPFSDAGVIGRDGGSGTVIQNGGTFNFAIGNNNNLFIGASGSPATHSEYRMNGGVLDMNGNTLGIGLGAGVVVTGIVSQASGLITNVGNINFSPFFTQGHGIYNLTGGSIYIQAGGITAFNGGGYEINLGGGTVGAQGGWLSALDMTLTGINGPVTFDTAASLISLSGGLSGPGGLIVTGGGILELSGANTYTGDTLVNAGSTLQLDVTGSGSGAIRLVAGATLSLNFSGAYAAGSLYTNGVALPVGTYDSASLPGFITGFGTVQVTSGISSGMWTGLGGNGNWSTAGNWDNNAVPIFPHSVTFAGNNNLSNTNDLNFITISGISFDPTAGPFVLGGNDVTMSGSISFKTNPPAPVTETINFGMTFTANQTINLPTNGNLTLGGLVSSSGSLTKSGSGTLTLGGVYDGFSGLTINGGTNVVTGNVAISGTGGSRFYVGDIGSVGTLIIQPGATVSLSGGFGDSGVIGRDSGSGAIIQNGGMFTFSPADPSQYLFVGASSSAATRARYDMNGGTFDMSDHRLAVGLSANNSTLITGVVNQVSGQINNVNQLTLGAFTFGPGRGIYRMTGGSIYIGANGIKTDSGNYEIYLGGGTVGAYANWSSALNMTLTASNGPVTFDTAGSLITLSGVLSGPGGINLTGGGTLELAGPNTFTGDMTVGSGMLQLDIAGSSSGAIRAASGAMLNLNFSGNFLVGQFFTNGAAVPLGTYNSGNLPGFIAGTGNLQVVGGVSTGLWTGLGSDNNWSTAGNWDHNAEPIFPIDVTFAGSTRLNNTNDLTSATANSITFAAAAGAFTLNGNSLGLNGNIAFSGNPSSPVTQTLNLPLTPVANFNVDVPANGTIAANGGISSPNNTMYKLNGGTLTLNGNNTFAGFDADGGNTRITGNTTVSGTGGNRVYVANADYIGGSVGDLTIENGANFTINGDFADAFVIGRDGGKGRVIQNGGTFNFNPGNQTYMFLGAANDPATRAEYDMNGGVLDMNGKTLGIALGVNILVTGIVNQASGVITNLGQIFFDPFFTTGYGIYNLTGGSVYIGSGGITVQSGGSYEMNLGGGTVGATTGWSSGLNMKLTGINGSVTFNPAGNTIVLSGVLSGPGGLMITGGGVLELSGPNTYAGDTVVNAGSTLRLDSTGMSPSAIRVATGGGLNLNYIGSFTVGGFYTNGVAVPAGMYTSANLPGVLTGNGALQVTGGIPTQPAPLTFSRSGNHITLNWPANYQGWILQAQTNSLAVGISTNWVDVPGSSSLTSTNIPIDPAAPTVFYRLRYPTP